MDARKSSKARPRLVTRRSDIQREEKYSGAWTQVPRHSAEWTLMNWRRDRPVPLQVVGSE